MSRKNLDGFPSANEEDVPQPVVEVFDITPEGSEPTTNRVPELEAKDTLENNKGQEQEVGEQQEIVNTLEREIAELEKTYSRGEILQAEYDHATSLLHNEINSDYNQIVGKRNELNRLGPITKIKYRMGEIIGRGNPEKEGRILLDQFKQNLSSHKDSLSHRTALSEKHREVFGRKIDEEYARIASLPEAEKFFMYSDFKPSTIEGKVKYLGDLKNFNIFCTELRERLKGFSNEDSERLEKSVLEKCFSADFKDSRPYIPEIERVAEIITEVNQEYRSPQKTEDGFIIKPENLILVHKTDFMPSQQRIKTHGNAVTSHGDYQAEKLLQEQAARQTVHFALNHAVVSHPMGDWEDRKYAILVPAEGLMKDNIVTLNSSDTYTFGDAPLKNKNSEMIISREAYDKMYKTLSAKDLNRMKKKTGVEIITISDTGETLSGAIDRRISERGYMSLQSNQHGDVLVENGGALSSALAKLAIAEGKSLSLHRSSPFKRLESSTSTIKSGGDTVMSWDDFNGENALEGSQKGLMQAREDLIKARGGEKNLTKRDIITLKKLERVVENYKYGPQRKKVA